MKTVNLALIGTLIAITLACGYSAKTTPLAAGTVPAIAQLSPNSATAGSTAFTMTVNGSNFGTKAVVNWNGTAQTANTTYVTGNQLMVAIPASMIANSGTVQVTVTNPGTTGTGMYASGGTVAETSSAVTFTIH
ncbi:MAG: hypothetical protein WA477_16950 [Candidatus Sulfotelmatobacter sp.]